MKYTIWMLVALINVYALHAQKVREMTIGDVCPDVTFTNVLNHPLESLKLSDYNGKLVILDFMITSCASCIAAFPHLQALQKKYANDLQVIVVTTNTIEQWNKLKSRNKLVRELQLPVIIGDSILSSYFKYEYVPHEVWLNRKRQVAAITTSQYVTETNIQYLLDGHQPAWPVKKDVGDYTFQKPMLTLNEPGYFNQPLYYSSLTGFRSGTQTTTKVIVDSVENFVRTTLINFSIPALYRFLLKNTAFANKWRNRFLVEVVDSSKLYNDKTTYTDQWAFSNKFCYESIMPLSVDPKEKAKFMLQDLNRFTAYHGKIEKRKMTCYIITALKKTSGKNHISEKGFNNNSDNLEFYLSISDWVNRVNFIGNAIPVLDETGNEGNKNICLPAFIGDNAKKVRKLLNENGFDLVEDQRELDIFVLSDK